MSAQAQRIKLPLIAQDMLRGLYAHRLMTSAQLHELFAPDNTTRWSMETLGRLEAMGLVARVRVASRRGRGRPMSAWYLTKTGAAITEGRGVEERPYRLTPELAAGPLQAHTLATNEVGLAFVRAARRYNDDFGSESWRNETAHRAGPAVRAELVISDAVLSYTVVEDDVFTYVVRFVEIDRATTTVDRLVAKLESYAHLAKYAAGWRLYPRFPGVMVVMAGKTEAALERRRASLEGLLPYSAAVKTATEMTISVTTLARLQEQGPHQPIFVRPGVPGFVDLRGRPYGREEGVTPVRA